MLGQGSFGGVFRAKFRGSDVAVKMTKPRLTVQEREAVMREADVMSAIPNHPHLVQFLGGNWSDAELWILTELCDGGSLDRYLEKNGAQIPLQQRLLFCVHIAAGMSHLEKVGFVHRDLAARNVLLVNRLVGGQVVLQVCFHCCLIFCNHSSQMKPQQGQDR